MCLVGRAVKGRAVQPLCIDTRGANAAGPMGATVPAEGSMPQLDLELRFHFWPLR